MRAFRNTVGVGSNTDVEVERWIADLAASLSDRLPEAVKAISASVSEAIPDLSGELLDAGIEGNVAAILSALRHNIPVERVQAPTAALEHARRLAQRGVPLNVVVRGYRFGQRAVMHLVFEELETFDIPPQVRIDAVKSITEMMFLYIDRISQQVVEVYEEERERWLETRNSMRALRVREVLDGRKPVDIDSAIVAISYPLRWHHVALVLWYPAPSGEADELGSMQRFLRQLATAVQAGAAPLFIATNRSTGWAWLPFQSAPAGLVAEVRRFAQHRRGSPSVAIGSPAAGVNGFRRSHAQADAAQRVALARTATKPTVVADGDRGLAAAALLGGTIEDARDWVDEVLGDLAADNDNDARLRETLRVFLGCNSSYTLAAEELTLHRNTVKYRVRRALVKRGRPMTTDRFDVELALLLCHWYGEPLLLSPKRPS
jgi:DNA-binding PucR family transcriptional regulator